MPFHTRPRQPVVLAVVGLLVLSAPGCKKDKDDTSQGGRVQEPTETTTANLTGPLEPAAVPPWTGTITTDFTIGWTRDETSQDMVRSSVTAGKVTYTDLVPESTEGNYSAVTSGGGTRHSSVLCQTGEYFDEPAMLEESAVWTVSGRDTKDDAGGVHRPGVRVREDALGVFVAGLTLGVTDGPVLKLSCRPASWVPTTTGTSRSDGRDLIGA
jgi:hypothetical protein